MIQLALRRALQHTRRRTLLYFTFARYWCTICTVMDPSPTADATRLMEEWRVSPAANTPGMMLSKINGSRSSFQLWGGRRPWAEAHPSADSHAHPWGACH